MGEGDFFWGEGVIFVGIDACLIDVSSIGTLVRPRGCGLSEGMKPGWSVAGDAGGLCFLFCNRAVPVVITARVEEHAACATAYFF